VIVVTADHPGGAYLQLTEYEHAGLEEQTPQDYWAGGPTMKTIAAIVTAAALFFGAATESQASFSLGSLFGLTRTQVIATVSVSQQQMFLEVKEGGQTKTALIWKVSTGRKGLDTPQGSFNPTWLDVNHKSDEYEDAPMPYAVFFSGGYAVHATEFTKRLGTPASHGCVRLSLENAQTFFNLVKTYGMTNTKIVVTE
jgi:lipoprotein-anchoring transpeptidase ErfK/SrfK